MGVGSDRDNKALDCVLKKGLIECVNEDKKKLETIMRERASIARIAATRAGLLALRSQIVPAADILYYFVEG